MAIPEAQLHTWSKKGADAQSRDTYATVKRVLEDRNAPYYSKSYASFLQGSYANDTNVYRDSDVDVVMRLDSTFYHDAIRSRPSSSRRSTQTFQTLTTACTSSRKRSATG